jgi:sulfur carrier protein
MSKDGLSISPPTIVAVVNGVEQSFSPPLTLTDLLAQLGYSAKMIAVEFNGEILHRQLWAETQIQNEDRLEIVTIVGGG